MATNSIRILHLIASNFVGGPEKQILHHAMDIRTAGFEVWVGSFRDQSSRAEVLSRAQELGLPVFECRSSGKFDLRAVRELSAFIKQEHIRLLCTHGFKANTVGVLTKKLAGVPQIAFCRGWTAETPRVRAYEFLERQLLHFADRVVCVSEAQAKMLARSRRFRSRLAVVQNAMLESVGSASGKDREALKVKLGFNPQTRLIGAIGRLSVEKGQRYLVEAAADLKQNFTDLKIVLLGEGRERENLENQVKQLGLADVVCLPGFQKSIAEWIRALDVLANCSLTEGLPNVVLEALAADVPVVATAVGGVPELIRDRETGLLVPPGDPSALAYALSEILRDRNLGATLSKRGRVWVETRFSTARQRETLLAIYRQCLGLSGSAPVSDGRSATPRPPTHHTDLAPAANNSFPFISVVIPVRNEEKHIGDVLQDLLSQDYPAGRFEVLIADGNSTDGTSQVVTRAANTTSTRVKLLANPSRLSSAGRNVGVKNSTGEVVVFVDGHCRILSRTLLRDAADLFRSTGADCLCRPQPLKAPGNTKFQEVVADARASALGHGLDSTIYGEHLEGFVDPTSSGASYLRRVFDKIGLYDEGLDACEDVEFNHRVVRAGLTSYISSRLAVQYFPRTTIAGLWTQMVRYGRGRFRLVHKHPDAFSVSQVIPAAFLIWLVAGGAFSLVSKPFAVFFAVSLSLYVATVLGYSVSLALRHGWRHLVLAPPVYAAIHLGLGAGFIADALGIGVRPRRSGLATGRSVSNTTSDASLMQAEHEMGAQPGCALGGDPAHKHSPD